jgi:hypothetical protein
VTEPKLTVSFGDSSNLAEITRVEKLTWDEFARRLTKTPPETEDKSSVGWYTPAEFESSHRHGKTFVARFALTLDYDRIDRSDIGRITGAFEAYAYAMYTTASHTPDKPRLRVVLPLSRPAGADEFQAVSRKVASYADIELAAGESHVVAQMMFLPSVKPGKGDEFRQRIHEGSWIDVDQVLASYTDWTDHASWPHRKEGDNVYNADELPVPPDQKPGIVGDFCRAFDVPAAISRFNLPYVPTATQDRWTYTAGSRPEGAIVYDGGRKLHSHHDTDPARGQHNSFDLVRLHRFSGLDVGVAEGTAVTERPSFKAMVGLAVEQAEVRRQQVIAELDAVDPAQVSAMGAPGEGLGVLGTSLGGGRFTVVPAEEFTGGKPLAWLVKSLLPKAQIGVIYGPSTVGKSFAALDLSAAVNRGVEWRELKTKKGRAVYVIAEGAGGFKKRISAYCKEFNVPLKQMPDIIADAPDLKDAKQVAELAHAIGEAELVVVDTLAASFVGNENSGEDMGLVLRHCKWLHDKTGAMVLLVHHSGKDETKGARGWSGIKAALDVEIEVSQQGPVRTLSLTKLKDGDADKKWGFVLRAVALGTDEDGDEVTSCVLEVAELSGTKGNRREPTHQWQKRVLTVARRVMAHRSMPTQELIRAVIASMSESDNDPALEPDERYGKIKDAIDALLISGVWLFKQGNELSLTRAVEAGEEFGEE